MSNKFKAIKRNIGFNIRAIRNRKGLTQDALAEQCQINIKTVREIENNQTTDIGLHTICKIVDGLDTHIMLLFINPTLFDAVSNMLNDDAILKELTERVKYKINQP